MSVPVTLGYFGRKMPALVSLGVLVIASSTYRSPESSLRNVSL